MGSALDGCIHSHRYAYPSPARGPDESYYLVPASIVRTLGSGVDLGPLPRPIPRRILGHVWEDRDGDGIRRYNEHGIPGVNVMLLLDGLDGRDAPYPTTTNHQGDYKYPPIAVERAVVEFRPPDGYKFSPPNRGDDRSDSDVVVQETGGTDWISLADATTVDAGLIPQNSLPPYAIWLLLGVLGGALPTGLYVLVKRRHGAGFAPPLVASPTSRSGGHVAPIDLFISYSSRDTQFAADLAQELEARGMSVFFAPASLAPGDSFVGEIDAALAGCSAAVLLWSANAAASPWVTNERHALTMRRNEDGLLLHLVPLDATPPPATLADVHQIRFDGARDPSKVAAELTGRISKTARPSRRTLRLDELSDGDCRLLAEHVVAAITDVLAGTAAPVVSPRIDPEVRLLAELDVPNLKVREVKSALEHHLEMSRIHRDNVQHLTRQKSGPAGAVIFYDGKIQQLEGDIAQETQAIRSNLRRLLRGLWKLETQPKGD